MRARGRVGWSRILAISGVWLSVLLLLAASWDVAISLAGRAGSALRRVAQMASALAERVEPLTQHRRNLSG